MDCATDCTRNWLPAARSQGTYSMAIRTIAIGVAASVQLNRQPDVWSDTLLSKSPPCCLGRPAPHTSIHEDYDPRGLLIWHHPRTMLCQPSDRGQFHSQ